jgi:oligoribonuclease NrnB/cAMP/cGMP phosphodiesterase (DHH superfamily)
MNNPSPTGKNVVCFYHDDADGRCSAAIIRRALGQEVICIPMKYGGQVPWDLVAQAEIVVVVDFSFPLVDMERIAAEAELTWIDHHITALTDLQSLANVPGARALDKAACVLAWNTYFPEDPVPMAVVYVGDRDIWKHEYPETRHFGEGLYHENTSPDNEVLWGPLLENDQDFLMKLIDRGRILYDARMKRGERALKRRGIEVEFEGHHTLILNNVGTGDLGEMIRKKGYAIGYCYYEAMQNGEIMTFVTLYSDTVDVSKIAKKFGGGGHKAAAGFSFRRTQLPFPHGSQIELVK